MFFVSSDGYRVEQVRAQQSLLRPSRPLLRVTWRGSHIADCATVRDVAQLVELATLVPVAAGNAEARSCGAGTVPLGVSPDVPAGGRAGRSWRT